MEIATPTIINGVATLHLRGSFGDWIHREVRAAAKAAIDIASVKELEINLAGVEYIDSNALGMLLLTRYDAQAVGKHVSLSGATGKVKEVLDYTNISKLFTLKKLAT